jgi:hypothetical protein
LLLTEYSHNPACDPMTRSKALAPGEDISRAILILRGQRVILAAELAALYGVTTKRLNE